MWHKDVKDVGRYQNLTDAIKQEPFNPSLLSFECGEMVQIIFSSDHCHAQRFTLDMH